MANTGCGKDYLGFEKDYYILGTNVLNSNMDYCYHKHLNRVTKRYNVHIIWVMGYNDIPRNDRADDF